MAIINKTQSNTITFDMSIGECNFDFTSSIDSAINQATQELKSYDETIESIEMVKPECDHLDYILAAGAGALCSLSDIFLVGQPGDSILGNLSDEWFEKRIIDFAKMQGWKNKAPESWQNAVIYLEKHFKIPYDQTHIGPAGQGFLDLSTFNHHFKSLAHNPTVLGLFFSILDQFRNTSHFVDNGLLITHYVEDSKFELQGKTLPGKILCGFVNWFGHIVSDVSGSSSSTGRGMGIPSPIWAWTNDIIAIKSTLHIPVNRLNKDICDMAVEIYKEGFDTRFQAVQFIPVLANELLVRFFYSIRRLFRYYSHVSENERSFAKAWRACEPFSNATVKRMLTVAHGVFCAIDIADASVYGFAEGAGSFNPAAFCLHLNIIGLGRFAISLYGEAQREINYFRTNEKIDFIFKEKNITEYYLHGLKALSALYDDATLLTFINDFENSTMYKEGFSKTAQLAELRKVHETKILRSKTDIDNYFKRGR